MQTFMPEDHPSSAGMSTGIKASAGDIGVPTASGVELQDDECEQVTAGFGSSQGLPDQVVDDQAQQSMLRDIDAILARLENGIAVERSALDALLDRLTSKAA